MSKILRSAALTAALALTATMAEAQNAMAYVAEDTPQENIQKETAQDLDAKYATDLLPVGSPAADIAVPSIDGGSISLADYAGKYVVLDFWASWCPDCRKDAPNVVAMYNKFHAKGVGFLGVSFDTNSEAWKKGIENLGLPYAQVSELKRMSESDMAQAYRIKWIPTIYVIDPQGNVALATVMSDKADAFLHSIYPDCAE